MTTDGGEPLEADGRIGDLYALPPEEFTAARDDLARALRAEGDRAGAAAVKKLRRPTVVAWALNQLGRRHPEDLRSLLDINSELQHAQRKALSGLGPAALREAQRRRRSVVDALTEQAAGLLRERGTDTMVHPVRRALEAASVDERAAAALVEGRLSQPPEVSTGFDTVEGLTLLTESPTVPETARAEEATPSPGQAEEEAAAQRAAAEEAAAQRAAAEEAAARRAAAEEAAARAADEAEGRRREAEEAAGVASEADATVERLTQELAVAREHAGQARTRSREAAAAARKAETVARRLERDRRAAERDLPA